MSENGPWTYHGVAEFRDKQLVMPRNGPMTYRHVRAYKGVIARKVADERGKMVIEYDRCPHAHVKQSAAKACAHAAIKRLARQAKREKVK